MGSSCCKNVRVTGVPQQEPVDVNNAGEHNQKPIVSVPSPMPTELEAEKKNTQSTAIHHSQHPNAEEEDETSVYFRLPKQEITNENELANDDKRVIPSQFPPIPQRKYNSES